MAFPVDLKVVPRLEWSWLCREGAPPKRFTELEEPWPIFQAPITL